MLLRACWLGAVLLASQCPANSVEKKMEMGTLFFGECSFPPFVHLRESLEFSHSVALGGISDRVT